MNKSTPGNGQSINYSDSGAGPPLVLLHGWGMAAAIFSDMAERLSADFRVLVPDLPGHGGSDPGSGYTLEQYAADIRSWLERLDLTRLHLLGWSFGGEIALQLASGNALPIEKLVLVATTPHFCQADDWPHGLPQMQVRAMERQYRRDPQATLAGFRQMMFSGEADAAAGKRLDDLHLPLPDAAAGHTTLATLRQSDLRSRLPAVTVPALVHHGRADSIIPASAGEYLARTLPQTEAELWDDVGHAPFLSCPERSQALWKDFLL